ncbi:MAG: cohesin domain-containing protein, partial [Eubacteriales bacterium]
MKKKVFLPLLVILMLVVASLPLFAAEEPTIYLVSNASGAVQAGETFTVDIMMKNNPGVFMISVQLADYSDNFEIQDITVGSLMKAGASNMNKELGRILFEAPTDADVTENGKLATVTFKVKSGVKNADHVISINVLSANNFEPVAIIFATEGAAVSTKCVHTYTYVDSSDTQHTGTCSKCGDITTKDHNYDAGVIKAGDDSTCTATGFTTYTCKDCSHEDRKNDVAMKPHSYGAWTKVDDDTHNRTCTVCSASDTSVAHSWNDGVITTYPTHTETGVKTYTCPDCLAQKTSSVPVNPEHTWGSWEKYTAEQHKHICSVGGEEDYADHVWNAGVVIKKAT